MNRRLIHALCVAICIPVALIAQERPTFSLDDLSRIKGVGGPRFAPGGDSIAFTLSQTDYDSGEFSSDIVLLSLGENSAVRRLAAGSSPQFSPDGKQIAYRARKNGKSGIRLHDLATGGDRFLVEVHQTDHFLGHGARKNFVFSPDGRFIAYVAAQRAENDADNATVRVFDRILYKTRTAFSDNRRTHVWVLPVTGGEPRLLTPGDYDEHSIAWSPDGSRIAFISNRSDDPDDNYRDDLYTIEVRSGHVSRMTDTLGTEFQPHFSPDGRSIAYTATERSLNTKDSPPENTNLFVQSLENGSRRNLTSSLDRRIRSISWHPGGVWIYFSAGNHGARPIYRVSAADGRIERLTHGNVTTRSYSLSADGQSLSYTESDVTRPAELWLAKADGKSPRRITSYNDELCDSLELANAQTIWFDSFDRKPVQGWLMKPAGFKPDRKFPLVLWVHGGPHGMYGYSFSSRFQLLSAAGYGVLYVNPRGSTGYGQAFADGCVMNWGGGDYKDLMAGLDYAIANNTWIDADRLGVVGGSYGGYMVNWIITQTDRFKAAIAVASVSNLISFYGTSLYQLLIEVEFNGRPWDNYPLLWQWSPLAHVRNVRTPTLFIHGENDHDVPITQAEEMYIALKKLGVDATLVRYAGEGHGIRRPRHRLDYNRRIFDWLERYLK